MEQWWTIPGMASQQKLPQRYSEDSSRRSQRNPGQCLKTCWPPSLQLRSMFMTQQWGMWVLHHDNHWKHISKSISVGRHCLVAVSQRKGCGFDPQPLWPCQSDEWDGETPTAPDPASSAGEWGIRVEALWVPCRWKSESLFTKAHSEWLKKSIWSGIVKVQIVFNWSAGAQGRLCSKTLSWCWIKAILQGKVCQNISAERWKTHCHFFKRLDFGCCCWEWPNQSLRLGGRSLFPHWAFYIFGFIFLPS